MEERSDSLVASEAPVSVSNMNSDGNAAGVDEMQQLRDQIAQLQAEKNRWQQQQNSGSGSASASQPTSMSAERFVFIPRDKKCPTFSGKSGMGYDEWKEEVQACMRARHLAPADQAYFLFDHLEGEAKEEIKYRPAGERKDPDKILEILRELYGCAQSHVALQEAFFSRKQQEGESLLEFSLALMSLMGKIKQVAPNAVPNADVLLRDQFIEYVMDGALRRDLKQFVRGTPDATLLTVRGEAIRWEREGMPVAMRARSQSVPSAYGLVYGVQGDSRLVANRPATTPEWDDVKEILKRQQEQLDLLSRSISLLQEAKAPARPSYNGPLICRRCHQQGHFARDCNGPGRPPRSRAASTSSMSHSGPSSSAQVQGNEHPPTC